MFDKNNYRHFYYFILIKNYKIFKNIIIIIINYIYFTIDIFKYCFYM